MIDLKKVRDNLDEYRLVCKNKKVDLNIDEILDLEEQRKSYQLKLDEARNIQKEAGKNWDYEKAKSMKQEIQNMEEEYKTILEKLNNFVLQMPDFVHPDVPVWAWEEDNVVIANWWEKPSFDFEIKDHVELMEKHDMLDIQRGVKMWGARSYILKWDGALLENAILQYTLNKVIEKWFTFMYPPHIVNYDAFRGTWYFPWGEEDAYNMEADEKRLIATSEIPLTSYHSDEILEEKELPKKYTSMTPCYRREAWSYGKDTHWLYRIHQFNKVEQVIILPADKELLDKFHQEVLSNAKEVLEDLGIPHRVLHLCTGDLSLGKYNSHDLESWMPSRDSYGETHSGTSFLEFQSRRLNLRYKGEDGKNRFCYTINCTAVASPRILIPLIENNQTADGKIRIPEVLRKYIRGREFIG